MCNSEKKFKYLLYKNYFHELGLSQSVLRARESPFPKIDLKKFYKECKTFQGRDGMAMPDKV